MYGTGHATAVRSEAPVTSAVPPGPRSAQQHPREFLVTLSGRVDVSTVTEIRDLLHAAVDAAPGRIVVDLAAVELLDATGLGVLVGAHRRAVRSGQSLVVTHVPPRVARLLQATRLSRVLCGTPR